MLMQMKQLKRLNIANNQHLSSASITEIIGALKTLPTLEEIDLSKNNINSVDCFRELADLIVQVRTLKTLSLRKTCMTDMLANYLAEPLVRA